MGRYYITFIFFALTFFASAQEARLSSSKVDTFVLSESYGSPIRATMLSAAIPGLGQIYNKRYWKLPIIYGGTGALIYFVNNNNATYKMYREAYFDISIGGIRNQEIIDYYYKKYNADFSDENTYSDDYLEKTFKGRMEDFKKWRDYCILGLAGLYLLNIIDAHVDAYLMHFDVSEDISLNIDPYVDKTLLSENIIGLKLSIDIK